MRRWLDSRALPAPREGAVLLGYAAVAIVLALAGVGLLRLVPLVSQRLVDAVATEAPRESVLHYRFRGQTRFVRVAVDRRELAAARRTDTAKVFSSVAPVRAGRVRALVDAQSRSRTIDAIARQLAEDRRELGLDSDEYVELMARFVQEIPYGGADPEAKLPVEVLADGRGVCDDRSIMLAALLVHEGYDTGVWVFDSQAHAAVGVRCLGPGMRGTGYAFLETTRLAFVGQANGTFVSRSAWRRNPQLIKLGGRTAYRADLEAAFVAGQLERARGLAHATASYARFVRTGPTRLKPVYQAVADSQVAAEQLANRLDGSSDERARMFSLLTESAGR